MQCELCGTKFTSKKSVYKHLRRRVCLRRKSMGNDVKAEEFAFKINDVDGTKVYFPKGDAVENATKLDKKLNVEKSDGNKGKNKTKSKVKWADGVVLACQDGEKTVNLELSVKPKDMKLSSEGDPELDSVDPLPETQSQSDVVDPLPETVADSFRCDKTVNLVLPVRPTDVNLSSEIGRKLDLADPLPETQPRSDIVDPLSETGASSFRCDQCPMIFLNENQLQKHVKTHNVEPQPSVGWLASKSPTNVVKRRESNEVFWCALCGRGFTRKSVVKNHLLNKVCIKRLQRNEEDTLAKNVQCYICDEKVVNRYWLDEHLRLMHNVEPPEIQMDRWTCEYCGRIFLTQKNMERHFRSNRCFKGSLARSNRKKAIPCEICGDKLADVLSSNMHLKSHMDAMKTGKTDEQEANSGGGGGGGDESTFVPGASVKVVDCETCGNSYSSWRAFRRHLRRTGCPDAEQSKSQMLTCHLCGKSMSDSYSLNQHLEVVRHTWEMLKQKELVQASRRIEIDGEVLWQCGQCNYTSKSRITLRNHFRTHTGDKPFKCGDCGKCFRLTHFLRLHVNAVHKKLKNYQCDVCGTAFSSKPFLVEHQRTHTGERPFVCDECGKSFGHKGSLVMHKKHHRNLRIHECTMCDKKFITNGGLNKHVARHNKVKRHFCAHCGKGFLDRTSLQDHESVHSEERPFSCDICKATFKLRKTLKQHDRTHRTKF